MQNQKSYLGVVNYFRAHILHAVQPQALMNDKLKDTKKHDKRNIDWFPELVQTFESSRQAGIKAVSLSQNCLFLWQIWLTPNEFAQRHTTQNQMAWSGAGTFWKRCLCATIRHYGPNSCQLFFKVSEQRTRRASKLGLPNCCSIRLPGEFFFTLANILSHRST